MLVCGKGRTGGIHTDNFGLSPSAAARLNPQHPTPTPQSPTTTRTLQPGQQACRKWTRLPLLFGATGQTAANTLQPTVAASRARRPVLHHSSPCHKMCSTANTSCRCVMPSPPPPSSSPPPSLLPSHKRHCAYHHSPSCWLDRQRHPSLRCCSRNEPYTRNRFWR